VGFASETSRRKLPPTEFLRRKMGSDVVIPFIEALTETSTTRLGQHPSVGGVQEVATAQAAEDLDLCSDEDLLERVTNGSGEALTRLFQRHGRSVHGVASRILQDHSEADDLRQEIFLYIFQKAKLFKPEKGSASSWIIQIAYHRAIDRRRYLASRRHYDASHFDENLSDSPQSLALCDHIDAKIILGRLHSELSRDQRETLELLFFDGYTLGEIAEKRDQTVGNVRHHYYRALERLRAHLFPKK
jgi:RNA polymerase sigma-70 factor (ECF subfamily)